ncbi:hypothetical protein PV326_013764, partial [Microctonus aethiopoides]
MSSAEVAQGAVEANQHGLLLKSLSSSSSSDPDRVQAELKALFLELPTRVQRTDANDDHLHDETNDQQKHTLNNIPERDAWSSK